MFSLFLTLNNIMKIINVNRIEYFFVETDETDWQNYRRNVIGNGDSWEVYYNATEIEREFQK